ncbi:MAG: hypothetical protein QOG03_1722 [Actinomycetota bacterium]|jgi:uncharacterized protein (TIGR03086 family)|nr:hypothetical protein [Actinomycetota bacterium]
MDLPAIHEQALAATREVVAGIDDDAWSSPTPCADYDVRTLTNHVVGGNLWVAELAPGGTIEAVGDRLDGDVLGDDATAAYDQSAKAAAAAFNTEGAMDRPVAVSYGPVPGSMYAGHRIIDVVVHGWDLAKATGQDTTLDPGLVQACSEILEPQIALLQGSGMFGTPVSVPDDADPQTKLLAALGRQA